MSKQNQCDIITAMIYSIFTCIRYKRLIRIESDLIRFFIDYYKIYPHTIFSKELINLYQITQKLHNYNNFKIPSRKNL